MIFEFFLLIYVFSRHDIEDGIKPIKEVYPHLIFHHLNSPLGLKNKRELNELIEGLDIILLAIFNFLTLFLFIKIRSKIDNHPSIDLPITKILFFWFVLGFKRERMIIY